MEGDYDFVEQPPPEYVCPVDFAVLTEPYQTQCCGNHLSQESYERLRGKPCPMCRERSLSAMLDKHIKRKVMSLKLRCSHKAEGCGWVGELGNLRKHLSANSLEGECLHVVVDCPHSCGKRLKRDGVKQHALECISELLKKQIVELRATVQRQGEQIDQCRHQINQQEAQIRQHVEQIKIQGDLIKVQGELINQQGEQINQDRHLLKQQGEQVKQDRDVIKQLEDQIKRQGEQLRLQGEQDRRLIKQQGDQIHMLMKLKLVCPVDLVMDDFKKCKKSNDAWYTPPFYSHLGGYKMCLKVYANGRGSGKGSHISVSVLLMRGEFDSSLKWPFCGDVTIQLKKTVPPHFQKIVLLNHDTPNDVCSKPVKERNDDGWGYTEYISHRDLSSGGYLKNNQLVFHVSDVIVRSM